MRVLLAVIFPPFAVVDKGCGSFLIVFLLTFCGWIPGVIGALIILNNDKKKSYDRGYESGYDKGYRHGATQNVNTAPPRRSMGRDQQSWRGW